MYQKAFGLQVRVKQKINRKIKRKERNFDEIEAQYTTEKKMYQKAFGLQVRFEKREMSSTVREGVLGLDYSVLRIWYLIVGYQSYHLRYFNSVDADRHGFASTLTWIDESGFRRHT
jgi:hypothetical protein